MARRSQPDKGHAKLVQVTALPRASLRILLVAAAGRLVTGTPRSCRAEISALYQRGYWVHRGQQLTGAHVGSALPLEVPARARAMARDWFGEPAPDDTLPSNAPWQRLEQYRQMHVEISSALTAAVPSVNIFVKRSAQGSAVAKEARSGKGLPMEQARSVINDALTSMQKLWSSVSHEIRAGFNVSGVAAFANEPDASDTVLEILGAIADFDTYLEWFAMEGVRDLASMRGFSSHMDKKQCEVLTARGTEFLRRKDAFMQTMSRVFSDAMGHLGKEVSDTFTNLGRGQCLDESGHLYNTFEAPGCQTPLDCIAGCRSFASDQCRGATFHESGRGCGRCELRVEEAFTNASGAWHLQWSAGSGTGEVASADGTPHVTCYKRLAPEWTTWPPLFKSVLEADMGVVAQGFASSVRAWRALIFKLDRAFGQFVSGINQVVQVLLQQLGT